MGKRDDKLKHKKNKKSTAMLVLIIAIIVLLILFIVLGSTLGGWIKALKDKSSQSSSSSVISSSSITSASDTVTDSSDSGNSNGSTSSEEGGYPENETQLTSDYQLGAPKKGDTIATVTTSKGILKFKLFPDNAPLAVENFTTKASEGYYDNTKFSILYTDQAVQSEGDDKTIHGGTTFNNEFSINLHNFYGALGCCNMGEENTNTNQFYIITATETPESIIQAMSGEQAQSMGLGFSQEIINRFKEFGGDPTLDGIFPVFGQLYEGFDVLASINSVPVDESTSVPKEEIKIISITIGTY